MEMSYVSLCLRSLRSGSGEQLFKCGLSFTERDTNGLQNDDVLLAV